MTNMTMRMRRIISDWEQIEKDFGMHKYITITPLGSEPYERYHATYFIKGIYLENGNVITIDRHEVEITLHADYPRHKPKCEILTPIFHPNFRDGQICIGDIWGAGESLSDIIINIGDMIQYKSWNSYSPLSAEAAQWALENRHLFPVGNISLHVVEENVRTEEAEIDLFARLDAFEKAPEVKSAQEQGEEDATQEMPHIIMTSPNTIQPEIEANDFDITEQELEGIEYVPIAVRMQSAPRGEIVKKKKINFKTILTKGLIWAFVGAIIGFAVTELLDDGNYGIGSPTIARVAGYENLATFYEYNGLAYDAWESVDSYYRDYCKYKGYSVDYGDSFDKWYNDMSAEEEAAYNEYYSNDNDATIYFDRAYNDYPGSENEFYSVVNSINTISVGLWLAVYAMFVGMSMGIGEGVYYGSKKNSFKYALIGVGVSLAVGFVAGCVAQWSYGYISSEVDSFLGGALTRAIGWSILGLGVGGSIGLLKPEKRRMKYCLGGGAMGGFLGGFLFDVVSLIVYGDTISRLVGLVVTGALIGIGIGILEQYAKEAWLNVVRGEFEGKEYLVFAGTTSIGNNGQNIIVLFKDKLIAPHHCDIILEGNQYFLVDSGSPLGTFVNGIKITKHRLHNGDTISIGNSVLVFNTR